MLKVIKNKLFQIRIFGLPLQPEYMPKEIILAECDDLDFFNQLIWNLYHAPQDEDSLSINYEIRLYERDIEMKWKLLVFCRCPPRAE